MKMKILLFLVGTLLVCRSYGSQQTIDGVTWAYYIQNGESRIVSGYQSPAVPRTTSGKVVVPDSFEGYPVTSIGGYAFYQCEKITEVVLPATVKNIDKEAFNWCSSITTVNLPNGLTNINDRAFYGCSSLRAISIPAEVRAIGVNAFQGCGALACIDVNWLNPRYLSNDGILYDKQNRTLVVCPRAKFGAVALLDGIERIEDWAFCGCRELLSVDIPSSVTNIGNSAFYSCETLSTVKIAEGLKSIGEDAFRDCVALSSISVPESVERIGMFAFYGCSALGDGVVIRDGCVLTVNGTCPQDLVLPKGTRIVGERAFFKCNQLLNVVFPSSLKVLCQDAFYWCENLKCIVFEGDAPLTPKIEHTKAYCTVYVKKGSSGWNCQIPGSRCWNGLNIEYFDLSIKEGRVNGYEGKAPGLMVIPETHEGRMVTKIAANAFYNANGVEKVVLPESITRIASYAFYGCSALHTITIPSFVVEIGAWAFSGCKKLMAVSIPSGVSEISDYLFDGCESLASLSLPEGVEKIGSSAFRGCKMTSVELPQSLQRIWSSAFSDCRELTSIRIPAGVMEINASVFKGCCSLASVDFPSSVTNIDMFAFQNCGGLTTIELPSGLKSIGFWAFASCDSLKSVKIPSAVIKIEEGAFNYCEKLNSVEVGVGVELIDIEAFYSCSQLQTLRIPKSVKSIGRNAFAWCGNLSTVTVDSGDTSRVRGLLQSSGFDCKGLMFVELEPEIPLLDENASPAQIAEVLLEFEDEWLRDNITDVETYGRFREWALKIGATDVKASPFAWASFATDSAALWAKMPTDEDLKVEEFKPSAMAGSFDFTVSVKDVTIGDKASVDNLKKLFGLEGAASLDSAAFSSENVSLDFKEPQDGKLKFTATPAVDNAKSFFMKVKVK